jgi:hypothetical protein
MAAGDRMEARYVDTDPGELWKAREPGTFCKGSVHGVPGSIVLFMVLPNGDVGAIRNAGQDGSAVWDIIDHGDGTFSASPSIQVNSGGRWHGYLERGVFIEV